MRSNWRRSAISTVRAAAAGSMPAKRSAASAGALRMLSRLPRRSCSQPSSEVRQRIATSVSWRSVRRAAWACTLPVATVATPRCSARSRRAVLRRTSPRSYGRCSSTKKRSGPKACASRAAAFGSCTARPLRAQPERQTRPSACSSTKRWADGGSERLTILAARLPGARVRLGQDPAQVRVALARLDEQRHVGAAVERHLGAGDRPHSEILRGMGELERAVDPVVVGERERGVAELGRAGGELFRQRGAVEERVRRVAVELDVRHGRCTGRERAGKGWVVARGCVSFAHGRTRSASRTSSTRSAPGTRKHAPRRCSRCRA